MKFPTITGELEIIDERTYTFKSTDNLRTYPLEIDLSGDCAPSSTYGLFLCGEPLVVIGAGGGATGVNDHSAILIGSKVYLAICDTVICLLLNPITLLWTLEIDPATCFGIHYLPEKRALISHGELTVARFSEDGKIIWSSSGADIFTEGFELLTKHIKVVDFNNVEYFIDYETGKEHV